MSHSKLINDIVDLTGEDEVISINKGAKRRAVSLVSINDKENQKFPTNKKCRVNLYEQDEKNKEDHFIPSAINVSVAVNDPTPKQIAAYLKARNDGVRSRTFLLEKIGYKEIIPTGRTIKKIPSWGGLWPPLRELMQNTIDHLNLLDHATGRRNAALNLRAQHSGAGDSSVVSYYFRCGEEEICAIHARGTDELIIEQFYTFPIASRALDTGVPDVTKQGSNSAGGFGDGFKTAAVALHALGKTNFHGLCWTFETGSQRITWDFLARQREAVGSFAACQVLEVHIANTVKQTHKENWMEQRIAAKGIATAFLTEAVPKLQVFWDVDENSILSIPSSPSGGGDYLAPIASIKLKIPDEMPLQSATTSSESSSALLAKKSKSARQQSSDTLTSLVACPGVYIRGIWVRPSKIDDTIMSFCGPRINVIGRDRNDVDDEDLLDAVAHVIMKCVNQNLLRELLDSLRGHSPSDSASSSASSSSWLLRSPRFFNRVLEKYKSFFLHDVFEVPLGAIFVSKKLTSNKDPFIVWASDFLKSRDASLFPLHPGSNKYLFEEVSEEELTEKCVKFLLAEEKAQAKKSKESINDDLRSSIKKLLTFMGLGSSTKVIFSTAVSVAFVHESMLFAPQASLTRNNIVMVLNTVQSKIGSATVGDGYSYSSLIQSIFETLGGSGTRLLEKQEVDAVINRAKSVQKENESFTRAAVAKGDTTVQTIDVTSIATSSASTSKERNRRNPSKTLINIVSDDSSPIEILSESPVADKIAPDNDLTEPGNDGIDQLISKANKRARAKGGEGNIIPSTDFADDGAGTETCLKPASQLKKITVHAAFGGGEMFVDANSEYTLRSPPTQLGSGVWSPSRCARLVAVREMCKKATKLIGDSIPTIRPLLPRIADGFDTNVSYEAFCNGTQVIVNFAAFISKLNDSHLLPSSSSSSSDSSSNRYYSPPLLHDLVITVTHELAHFLTSSGGHGQEWRDTHMSLLQKIYSAAFAHATPGRRNAWACSCANPIFASCISCSSSSSN